MPRSKGRKKKSTQVQRMNQTPPAKIHDGAQLNRKSGGVRAEWYSGLVPHPEHAERFEALLPGAMDRFVGMAERQGEHRQKMEKKFLNFNGWSQILGVVFAGMTVLGGIAAGTFLVYSDKDIQGFAAMLVPLSTVAVIFYRTRKSQKKEAEGKALAERR